MGAAAARIDSNRDRLPKAFRDLVQGDVDAMVWAVRGYARFASEAAAYV